MDEIKIPLPDVVYNEFIRVRLFPDKINSISDSPYWNIGFRG